MARAVPWTPRVAVGLLLLGAPGVVVGQAGGWDVSLYGGISNTGPSDVTLALGDDLLRFDDVPWDSEDLTSPIYYGFRVTRWIGSEWGVVLDFTHAKLYGQLDALVSVAGTRAGAPVDARERLDATFERLQFSHGHNLLTLNLARRWPLSVEWRRAPVVYVGAGVGVAIPHVEVEVGGGWTEAYRLGGGVLQGFGGMSLLLFGALSAFGEYRLSWASIEAGLDGGGTIALDPVTHHFEVGLIYAFVR